jgi:hypothetical protein
MNSSSRMLSVQPPSQVASNSGSNSSPPLTSQNSYDDSGIPFGIQNNTNSTINFRTDSTNNERIVIDQRHKTRISRADLNQLLAATGINPQDEIRQLRQIIEDQQQEINQLKSAMQKFEIDVVTKFNSLYERMNYAGAFAPQHFKPEESNFSHGVSSSDPNPGYFTPYNASEQQAIFRPGLQSTTADLMQFYGLAQQQVPFAEINPASSQPMATYPPYLNSVDTGALHSSYHSPTITAAEVVQSPAAQTRKRKSRETTNDKSTDITPHQKVETIDPDAQDNIKRRPGSR